MKKEELKYCLQNYPEIEEALKARKAMLAITRSGRKKTVKILPWMYRLPECLEQIMQSEPNVFVRRMINESVIKGKRDKEVIRKLPISESTYYRWKVRLTEKIYAMYISMGEVTQEEILAKPIDV